MTRFRRCLRATLIAVLTAPLLTIPHHASAATSAFRGVNWADARDNYVDGWVIPTGLTAGDSYDTVRTKADGIIAGFQQQLGANTVRLPVNPQSVNSDWWARYKGAADSAVAFDIEHTVRIGFADDAETLCTGLEPVGQFLDRLALD